MGEAISLRAASSLLDCAANDWQPWFLYHGFLLMAAQAIAGKFAETFKEFPARQKAASFTIDDALAKMGDAAGGGGH